MFIADEIVNCSPVELYFKHLIRCVGANGVRPYHMNTIHLEVKPCKTGNCERSTVNVIRNP